MAYKILCIVCTSILTSFSVAQTNLISLGSSWKYLDNGSDQGTTWSASVFNPEFAVGLAKMVYIVK
jgi:acid phosphatase type 7